MLPYYFLQFFPPVCGKLIGKENYKTVNRVIIFTFFAVFLLMLSFRNISIGTDLQNYYSYFQRYSRQGLNGIIKIIKKPGEDDVESGYIFLNWIFNRFSHDYQWFLAVVAIISVVPVAVLYYKNSEHAYLTVTLFTTVGIFSMFFSGLRQIIAVSIGILAYWAAKNKKIVRFILLVFLATLFHRTAFVLLFLYPCYHLKLKKKHLIYIIPVLAAIFVFNKQIFLWLAKIIPDVGDVEIKPTSAYMMLALYIIFAVWCFIVGDETKFDPETFAMRNILIVAVVIQMFAPIYSTAMRMNYYFLPFIPLIIAKIIDRAKPNMQELAKVSNVVLCLFFTVYRILSMYTDADILQIYPYLPFWKG